MSASVSPPRSRILSVKSHSRIVAVFKKKKKNTTQLSKFGDLIGLLKLFMNQKTFHLTT